MARPGYEADKYSLMLYDRKTQKVRNLAQTLDHSVDEIIWGRDSSVLYFSAEEKGRNALFKISLEGFKAEKILDGHTFNSTSLLPDGKTFVFLRQAMNRPNDLFSLDLGTKKFAPPSDFNRDLLDQLAVNGAEEL